ncbi:MAG: cupin domain-containing protein [Salinigranum sp.]
MAGNYGDVPPQEPVVASVGLDLSVVGDDVEWEDASVLGLPEGLQIKIISENEAEGRTEMLVKYPPGYVEPRHTHESAHACLILEGRVIVDGRELTAGDYIYGQEIPHGPWEFPDGGINFVSFVGGSPTHEWDDEDADADD